MPARGTFRTRFCQGDTHLASGLSAHLAQHGIDNAAGAGIIPRSSQETDRLGA